jgi:hypothetical protein
MTCFVIFETKWRRTQSTIGAALILASVWQSPALAQFWTQYENAQHHYAIDIPPGFESVGEHEDGTGATYIRLEAEQVLSVWAGENAAGVEAEALARAARMEEDGWGLGLKTLTPDWAALSAQRDHRIAVQRLIELCTPNRYAAFRMEFHIRDLTSIEPVLEGMGRSFMPVNC